MPGLPITHSRAPRSLLADILVAKYADHTPLYRQSQIAERDGVTLDPGSMGRWAGQCEALCDPLAAALRSYKMTASKLPADDTPIPVLAPGNKKAKTRRLWVYVRDDTGARSKEPAAVWFAYSPNGKGIHPRTHLARFQGVLQADAYGGFNELSESGRVRETACWDHARRYIYDVHACTPPEATRRVLKWIGELHGIKAVIHGQSATKRWRARQERIMCRCSRPSGRG